MEIRKATNDDIPGILAVLKASLGETSSKKSEEVWRYKHELNPFGKSLVLLAIEENEIIGVRAFMRWRWQKGNKEFSAFRAVDTATHPDHQGKGIFKKLTMKALHLGKEEGSDFVFNTPNSQSRPGYQKMGWNLVNKIRISFTPVSPLSWKFSKIKRGYAKEWLEEREPRYINNFNLEMAKTGKLFTPKSWEYLKWRYLKNPLQEYQILASDKIFLAGYVKQQGKINELRIAEAIKPSEESKLVRYFLKKWSEELGVQVISSTPLTKLNLPLTFTSKLGPILTFRKLNSSRQDLDEFLNLNSWAYSTGDLELF